MEAAYTGKPLFLCLNFNLNNSKGLTLRKNHIVKEKGCPNNSGQPF